MIGRIGDRATFDALQRDGRRARRDPVTVLFLPDAGAGVDGDVRVAYSVGRRVGTAVDRNRVRRRLRAAMREVSRDGDGLSSGAYLVLVRPEAGTTPYPELKRSLGEACAAAARSIDS